MLKNILLNTFYTQKTYAQLVPSVTVSCIFMSCIFKFCIFTYCNLVHHLHVLQFQHSQSNAWLLVWLTSTTRHKELPEQRSHAASSHGGYNSRQ